jgi:hypothetical protein
MTPTLIGRRGEARLSPSLRVPFEPTASFPSSWRALGIALRFLLRRWLGFLAWWDPQILLHFDAGFDYLDAFGFQKFSLQRTVRFANEDFAVCGQNTMPRNAFSGRRGGHGAARGAGSAGQAQNFSNRSVG